MKESKTVEVSRSEVAEIMRTVLRAKYKLPKETEIALQFKWRTDPNDRNNRIVDCIEAVISSTDVSLGLIEGVPVGERKIDFNL